VLHRPAHPGTPLPSRLICPDCGVDGPTLLRFRDGLAGSACPQCAGALLGPGQVTTLLALANVEDAAYKREVRLGTVGGRLVSCPQCGTGMRGIRLRAVLGHGCPACGSMWLDRTGLARLSGGRSFAGPAPQRPEPPLGTHWAALAALVALIVLTLPWVGVRTGLCPPATGLCSSVPAAPWGHDAPP
jgi:Zn-finger nucleic acid-binding protein